MRTLVLLITAYMLIGCSALMSQEPVSRSLTVPESPDAAYQRATRGLVLLGGEITQANAQSRVLSAKVHNAVVINVLVTPAPDGAHIEAVCTLMPNKLVIGTFDECEQYQALLR